MIATRFRVDRPLGASSLWEATELVTGRNVVLELEGGEPTDGPIHAPHTHSAPIAQRLDDEHVVHVLASGALPDGTPWIVREPVIASLASEVRARGPIPRDEAVAWTLEVCEALAEGHALGIAHGDVGLHSTFLARGERGRLVAKLAWTRTAKASRVSEEDVARDIAGAGALLSALLTGQSATDDAPTVPGDIAVTIARARGADRSRPFRNVGELAIAIAPFAPTSHEAARNTIFLLSRAGIMNGPAQRRSMAGESVPRPSARLDSPREEVVAPASYEDRTRRGSSVGVFALVALVLLGLAVGGTMQLSRGDRAAKLVSQPATVVLGTDDGVDAVTATSADEVTAEAIDRAPLPAIDEESAPHLVARPERPLPPGMLAPPEPPPMESRPGVTPGPDESSSPMDSVPPVDTAPPDETAPKTTSPGY